MQQRARRYRGAAIARLDIRQKIFAYGLNAFLAKREIRARDAGEEIRTVLEVNPITLACERGYPCMRLETGALITTLMKLLGAGVVLAAICLLANLFIFEPHPQLPVWQKAGSVLGVTALGCVAFFATAYALRVAELQDVATLIRRKLRR